MLTRIRAGLGNGAARLRVGVWAVAQSAVAASLAFFVVMVVLGHERPFFAPISAVICLSTTLGSRPRRTVELVFGVAVGLMVVDLLVLVIGTGTLQIAAVVLLAMAAAVAAPSGPLRERRLPHRARRHKHPRPRPHRGQRHPPRRRHTHPATGGRSRPLPVGQGPGRFSG
ncbi:MAG: FUSC family protein [Actinomycetota bacterium]|nr:FUSC family protein [Actinomycetota bacterium]